MSPAPGLGDVSSSFPSPTCPEDHRGRTSPCSTRRQAVWQRRSPSFAASIQDSSLCQEAAIFLTAARRRMSFPGLNWLTGRCGFNRALNTRGLWAPRGISQETLSYLQPRPSPQDPPMETNNESSARRTAQTWRCAALSHESPFSVFSLPALALRGLETGKGAQTRRAKLQDCPSCFVTSQQRQTPGGSPKPGAGTEIPERFQVQRARLGKAPAGNGIRSIGRGNACRESQPTTSPPHVPRRAHSPAPSLLTSMAKRFSPLGAVLWE